MLQSLQSHTFFCTWEEIFLTERSQHCFECLTLSYSNYNQHTNAVSDWTFQDPNQKHSRLSTHKQQMGDAAGQELLSSLYSNNVRTLMPIVTANTLNHQVSTRLSGNYLSPPLYTWPSSTLLILQPTKLTTKKVSIYRTRNKSQGRVLVFCDWHLCRSELWFIKPCHHSNHNPKHEETNNNHPECKRVGSVYG